MLLRNKILLLFLVCSVQFNGSWICNAQTNLIQNGGFEDAHPSQDAQAVPNNFAQIYQLNNFPRPDDKYLRYWKTRQRHKDTDDFGGFVKIHSPDWFKGGGGIFHIMREVTEDIFGNPIYIPAGANSGGVAYIGMMDAELVQQKLEVEDLIEGEDYTISMYIRPVTNTAMPPYCFLDGTWEFMKSKTEINMTLTDSSGQDVGVNWKILRLYYKPFSSKKMGEDTNGEGDLWIEEKRGNDVYEFHFFIFNK